MIFGHFLFTPKPHTGSIIRILIDIELDNMEDSCDF